MRHAIDTLEAARRAELSSLERMNEAVRTLYPNLFKSYLERLEDIENALKLLRLYHEASQ